MAALTATLAAMTPKTKGATASKDTKEEAEGAAISAAHWPKSCHSKRSGDPPPQHLSRRMDSPTHKERVSEEVTDSP